MARSPRNSYRAWTAMNRTARGFLSAPKAMLRVLRRCCQLAPVNGFVARDADSDAVCNVNDSFGVFCNGFDMVGMKLSTVSTQSAFESVSLKNRYTPLGQVSFSGGSLSVEAMPTLPSTRLFTYAGTASTLARAKHGSFKTAYEWLSAPSTRFFNRGISMRPTFLATISGQWGAICLNLILRSANLTSLCLLGVFHGFIMPCNKYKCKHFIVRMTDAFPGIEIRRIE